MGSDLPSAPLICAFGVVRKKLCLCCGQKPDTHVCCRTCIVPALRFALWPVLSSFLWMRWWSTWVLLHEETQLSSLVCHRGLAPLPPGPEANHPCEDSVLDSPFHSDDRPVYTHASAPVLTAAASRGFPKLGSYEPCFPALFPQRPAWLLRSLAFLRE